MVKKFIQYYKPHKGLFLLDFSCAFLISIIDLISPMVAKNIVDSVIPSKNLKLLMIIGVVLLIIYVFRSVLQYIVDYWGHMLGVRMEYDMREDLFSHINKLPFSYFDNNKTGQIMSRLVNDLNEIAELAHHGPEDLFIAAITLIGSSIMMMMLNVKLALAILIIIPFMLYFGINKNRLMRKSFRELRSKLGDINSQAEDSISGIRVVKAFNNEQYEQKKFRIGNMNFIKAKEDSYKVMAEFFSGITFFSNFINLIILVYGGYLITTNNLTIGDLVGFLLYISLFLQPIRKISNLIENYQKGMASFSRFIEIMNVNPSIKDSKNAINIENVKGDIKFEHVHFSYEGKKDVLNDINLHIKPNETVAFVGASGVGKTTLCNLIPRFYDVIGGSIKIDNVDIKDIYLRSLRNNIGVVQQDVFLFYGTIKENIAYGNIEASDDEIIKAAKNANAHEFIISLENGYDRYIGERGVKLSGGQKQRIAIARMFLRNPKILILDEATSALDNKTEQIIQKALHDLSKDRTTLVIAHRLATIKNADRIVVLDKDKISEVGKHEELINKKGIYASLYQSQFKV
ncbi:MAG TPA: ABC transporter ATP-binding protein [Peptostreptococcaceae bacterium]|nr:ABC transporter ATP-binding protein [Peptostreptococcaceae bacterium]